MLLPLDGVTVLDLTRFLPGAMTTMCLLRFGAEVIKIERPGEGDPARHLDGGKIFRYTNAGKKSVAIDLKSEKGTRFFRELAAVADVVFENFRPGVMERLGIGYETLAQRNPALIYVSLTGYDSAGAMSETAGHDINYVSMTGVLDLLTRSGARQPSMPAIQLADIAGGSHQSTIGILLALLARQRTGRGQRVEVPMATAIGEVLAMPLSAAGSPPDPIYDGLLSGRFACYNVYRCADDRWIAVGALEPKFWSTLCNELDRPELIPQQFSPEPVQSRLRESLSTIFSTHTAREWDAALGNKECCVTPVRTFDEARDAGQFSSYSVGVGARLSDSKAVPLSHLKPPAVGEHLQEVARRLKIPDESVRELVREGAIG